MPSASSFAHHGAFKHSCILIRNRDTVPVWGLSWLLMLGLEGLYNPGSVLACMQLYMALSAAMLSVSLLDVLAEHVIHSRVEHWRFPRFLGCRNVLGMLANMSDTD